MMDKLQTRYENQKQYPELYDEIKYYLRPWEASSRERIVNIAIEKMEGTSSTDLAAKATEAAEAAILEVFHKGIDQELGRYMK